jgi:T3SS negative regulator,GrlR
MVEGFWIVQFEGVQGNGGGVVLFIKGRIFGGDSGFVYTGTYQTDEKTITGRVAVRNFLPEVASVFGIPGDYELSLKGNVVGRTIEGSASLANQEAMGIVVKLTKVGDLPQ